MNYKNRKNEWEWAIIDYSTAILYESVKDPEEGCVMDIHPCGSCMERQKGKDWQWGLCTTPSEADAKLIASAPKLFNACQQFMEHYQLHGQALTFDVDIIRQAIAKAL